MAIMTLSYSGHGDDLLIEGMGSTSMTDRGGVLVTNPRLSTANIEIQTDEPYLYQHTFAGRNIEDILPRLARPRIKITLSLYADALTHVSELPPAHAPCRNQVAKPEEKKAEKPVPIRFMHL